MCMLENVSTCSVFLSRLLINTRQALSWLSELRVKLGSAAEKQTWFTCRAISSLQTAYATVIRQMMSVNKVDELKLQRKNE